jgi:hypothetical protein
MIALLCICPRGFCVTHQKESRQHAPHMSLFAGLDNPRDGQIGSISAGHHALRRARACL